MITGKKNVRCGLIGARLSHSFSPQIHGELADYSYSLFEMPECDIESFLKSGEFDALNVTIPHKKAVMPYLDEISDEAARIGSVNTIIRTPSGALRGENTDHYGFMHALKTANISVKGKKVLILGTGGASLTAKTVCEDLEAKETVFVSRSGEVNYENVYLKHPDAEIIINCTPVGMYPNNGASPIRLEKFKACQGVADMIYNPARTQLLLDAESLGIKHVNGLTMLVAQAKKACELFIGETVEDSEIGRITDSIASKTSNIILVGMPGCGKTTVGRLLSEMTGRKFIDTDDMITVSQGKTPSEIIRSDGVEKFREIEHVEIENAGKLSGMIISTGGGAVTRDENYAPLHQNGKIVFIHRAIDKLATSDRPLSVNLEAMYSERLPAYRRFCDIEVSNNGTVKDCAAEILERLSLHCK